MRASATIILALCGIAACSADSVDESEFGSTQTLTDGLKIKKMFVPPGCSHKRRSKNGDQMSMQYTGSLTNGKIFDSSRNPGRSAFQFTLGAGQVIKGWDEGVMQMSVGERAELTCTPDYAYGAGALPADHPPQLDADLRRRAVRHGVVKSRAAPRALLSQFYPSSRLGQHVPDARQGQPQETRIVIPQHELRGLLGEAGAGQ